MDGARQLGDTNHEFFARCASGFEDVLADELRGLGAQRVRPLKGGVAFFGDATAGYCACLWCRTATRVQMVLARVDAQDAQALYDGASAFAWEQHVAPGATIAVHAHGENPHLRNTQFTALKVKDAVCDRLRRVRGERPDVDAKDPDFAIDVSLHARKATLYFNMSGQSLHRRGYRADGVQTEAPLKETLAAGILLAAGWAEIAGKMRESACVAFVDPMCGSGTLPIEAAMIAADVAPGILREKWGFEGWVQHDAGLWASLLAEADERLEAGLQMQIRIVAGDSDEGALSIARANAKRAGVGALVGFHVADAADLDGTLGGAGYPLHEGACGLMAVNPPYGQRLLEQGQLPEVYAALSKAVDALPAGWKLAVITPDASIDTALGRVPGRVLSCYNGPIEAAVRFFDVMPSQRVELAVTSLSGEQVAVAVAERNSEQFAARLRKVAKERAKWARKAGVSCFRIYDADLPDYALSVDVYQGAGEQEGQTFARVAEYQAPASVDEQRAARRYADALAIVPAVLGISRDRVFSKVRRREKGGGQYRDARNASKVVHTAEAGYLFEVDMNGYLDTGIFLDHRTTRAMVGRMAQGKRFLNLFAYTGTATVHAAGGGAASTVTVDMSQTYLAWARRNMEANGFRGKRHRFERADVLQWIEGELRQKHTYDLVFCDPPTFSNSKSMGSRTFSVQRDHVRLLESVAGLLADGGTIVFSCNLRNFRIDEEALARAGLFVRDVTADTIPHDFERTPKVHRCYLVQKAP